VRPAYCRRKEPADGSPQGVSTMADIAERTIRTFQGLVPPFQRSLLVSGAHPERAGTVAVTVVPSPGLEITVSLPPTSSARSVMLRRP
jgi:hypothetical protein